MTTTEPAPAAGSGAPMLTIADSLAFLESTPADLRSGLVPRPTRWVMARPAPESWSAFEVVCHLAYTEEVDWLPRVRIILEQGEGRPFDPVDHGLASGPFEGRSIGEVLDTFEARRRTNVDAVRALALGAADLERTGTHPIFGRVTLGQLIATWVVHDLNHASQVQSALAYGVGDAVGPWRTFLGILEREP
jgi:hypothetical protein